MKLPRVVTENDMILEPLGGRVVDVGSSISKAVHSFGLPAGSLFSK